MLNLSVSIQPCVPGKRSSSDASTPRPYRCETCGAPGGRDGVLLERHIITAGKVKYLCPLCHACLHLDVAGRMKAGRVIWLPEFTQEQLNLLSVATFVARRKANVHRKDDATKGIVATGNRLLDAFAKRSESIETFLGGNAVKSLMPRQSLSSPTHIASLLVRVKRESKLAPKDLAARVNGMRLLPDERAFDPYISAISRAAVGRFDVPAWASHVQAAHAAQQQASEVEPQAHFDAEPVEG